MQDGPLVGKFNVSRADGQPDKPAAQYFVLDWWNDFKARQALRTYRGHCGDLYPTLHDDLGKALAEADDLWPLFDLRFCAICGHNHGPGVEQYPGPRLDLLPEQCAHCRNVQDLASTAPSYFDFSTAEKDPDNPFTTHTFVPPTDGVVPPYRWVYPPSAKNPDGTPPESMPAARPGAVEGGDA